MDATCDMQEVRMAVKQVMALSHYIVPSSAAIASLPLTYLHGPASNFQQRHFSAQFQNNAQLKTTLKTSVSLLCSTEQTSTGKKFNSWPFGRFLFAYLPFP